MNDEETVSSETGNLKMSDHQHYQTESGETKLIQKNTVIINFDSNHWLKWEDVYEFLKVVINESHILSLYELNKRWIVTLQTPEEVQKLIKDGVPYTFQGNNFKAYPIELKEDVIEVTVSKTPFIMPNEEFQKLMSLYGEVLSVERLYHKGTTIASGIRKVKMKLQREIPVKIRLPKHMPNGYVYIYYPNRQPIQDLCYICKKQGHKVENCPKKSVCQRCGGRGLPHLTKHCKEMPIDLTTQLISQREETIQEVIGYLQKSTELNSEQNTSLFNGETANNEQLMMMVDEKEKSDNNQHLENVVGKPGESSVFKKKTDEAPISTKKKDSLETPSMDETDTLLIGDSQTRRMKEHLNIAQVEVVSLSGGKFEDGYKWLEQNPRKIKNCILYFGTNHINSRAKAAAQQVRNLCYQAKENSENVYVMGLVPYKGTFCGPHGVTKLNKTLETEAKRCKAIYVETPKAFLDNEKTDGLFENDLIHVNDKGAKILIDTLVDNIECLQKKKRKRKLSPMKSEAKKGKERSSSEEEEEEDYENEETTMS